jgi:hypothetical protein
MGEITRNLSPRQFYRVDGKDKCIKKAIKGGGTEKVDGLQGWLQDIRLKKAQNPTEKLPHYEWVLVLTDKREPESDDIRYHLGIKEGTYLSERFCNILAGINHPGELTISVYESKVISKSAGVSIKVNGEKVNFRFGEKSETGYVGIPEGEPKGDNRISFFRDLLYKDVFTNLLGREWDGSMDVDSSLQQASSEEAQAAKFSVKGELAESKALEKLNSKTAAEITAQWPTIVNWVKGEMTFPQDTALLDQFIVMANRVFLGKGVHDQTLKEDGTIEADDLPF